MLFYYATIRMMGKEIFEVATVKETLDAKTVFITYTVMKKKRLIVKSRSVRYSSPIPKLGLNGKTILIVLTTVQLIKCQPIN